ncbi:MAG: glutathione S-transferase family protein, partial [Solirubrobacterales bacterium]
MKARLYVIPASHPSIAVQLMLEHKGISYKRTDLMPVVSKGVLRAVGFPGVTVPALKVDGDKVQGSRQIARELERLRPEPPIFPADAEKRAAVEEAERFGDEELQHPIRQRLWWGFKHNRDPMRSYSEGAKLGVPIGLAVKTGGPLVALSARFNEASDENARKALEVLPGLLDRADAWVESGVL